MAAQGQGLLEGRIAWVTGGGGGIGSAIAARLLRSGARVALLDRDAPALERAAAALIEQTGCGAERIATEALDVSDAGAVDAAAGRLLGRWGRIDLLVNNAGINTPRRHFRDSVPEEFQRIIAVNLTGAWHCVRAVLPAMRAAGGGLIVSIASIAGKMAFPLGGPAYNASKHALVGFSHSIQEEEWRHGIRACAICPGEVNTPILKNRPVPVPEEERRRFIQPEDLAELVATLATLPPRVSVTEIVVLPTHRRRLEVGKG